MSRFVSKRDESVRLFGNPLLEYLSRAHPLTPLFYLPILSYFAYVGVVEQGWLLAGTLFLSGILLWTLSEYWIHRGLFHYEAKAAWSKRLHYLWHGVHHDYPRDHTRLVLPLLFSVPLAFLFYGLLRIVAGSWHPALFAGFALGYINYDLTHYALHHLHVRNGVFRWLRKWHLRHHFADEHTGYGVSTPLWDFVFRTQHATLHLPMPHPAIVSPPAPIQEPLNGESPLPEAPFVASNG